MKCTDPRKDLKRFRVDGGVIDRIAAVLFSSGDLPVWVNFYPSHSISVFCKMTFLEINSQIVFI